MAPDIRPAKSSGYDEESNSGATHSRLSDRNRRQLAGDFGRRGKARSQISLRRARGVRGPVTLDVGR